MRLFYHRPLAAACAFFIFSLFAAYFLSLSLAFWLCIGIGALCLALLLFCVFGGFRYRRLCLFLVILAVFAGGSRTVYEQSSIENIWAARYEKEADAEFTVEKILYTNTYGSELLVDIESIDGERVNSRAVLRGEEQLPFYVGDRVCASITIQKLDFEAYSADAAYRYRAEGAKALLIMAQDTSPILVADGTNGLAARLLDLRGVLSHRISRLVGGEEGNLLAAMLLGSKNLLSDQTVRDFRLSGVSHLLALSGLHLVILVGLLERCLYLLGAGKRLRIAILFPLCIFYLMLTGCNYSLLRAMIMLGFVYLSALLREDHDSLTALLLVGSMILFFTPYAVFSLSFQMTMLATFGILAFIRMQAFLAKLLPKGKGKTRFLWSGIRFVCSSLLISVSTTVALLPVLWLTVGSYSLMTPIANLLLVPLAPLILLCATLTLVLPFPIVGALAGIPASVTLALTELLGSAQAVISLQQPCAIFVILPVILATAVLLVVDLKRFYALTILPAIACMLSFVVIFCLAGRLDQSLSVIYRQSGKNEGLILVRGTQAMICDLSMTSLTQLNGDWLEAQRVGATELSVLLFTHYHSKSVTALTRFTQSVVLRELWLPKPVDESQWDICQELLEVAIRQNIRVTIYETQTIFTVFDTGILTVSNHYYHSRSTEPAFALSLRYGEEVICYHTASLYEYLDAKGCVHECTPTHLILGAHGPIPKAQLRVSFEQLQSVLIGSEIYYSLIDIQENAHYILVPARYRYEME